MLVIIMCLDGCLHCLSVSGFFKVPFCQTGWFSLNLLTLSRGVWNLGGGGGGGGGGFFMAVVFVCFLCTLAQKVRDRFWWFVLTKKCWQWYKEPIIKFWWWSRNFKAFLFHCTHKQYWRYWPLLEVCALRVLLLIIHFACVHGLQFTHTLREAKYLSSRKILTLSFPVGKSSLLEKCPPRRLPS